jgi:LmbE family N-acetylglucosaminyl deacetylase
MAHYEAVFVSPHLDDAVFSCAAEIVRSVERGPVLVLNVFTRYPENVSVRSVILGAERYVEEKAAADFLRFASHNLDEPDAFFRRPQYRSIGNIFRPPVREDLEDYLTRLRMRVFDFLQPLTFERLYAPLGIGWHVDHVLTHAVFEPWMERNDVTYYEDAPYSLFPNATRYRLNELTQYAGRADDESLRPRNYLAEWWSTANAYASSALIGNLKPAFIRPFARAVVGGYLYRLMSSRRRAGSGVRHRAAEEVRKPLDDELLATKISAAMLYRSQFKEFFHDRDDCIGRYTAYSRQVDANSPPLERFWRFREARPS